MVVPPLFICLSLSHILLFFDFFIFSPASFTYIYLISRLTHYNISVYLIHCPLQINLGFFCFLIKKKKKKKKKKRSSSYFHRLIAGRRASSWLKGLKNADGVIASSIEKITGICS